VQRKLKSGQKLEEGVKENSEQEKDSLHAANDCSLGSKSTSQALTQYSYVTPDCRLAEDEVTASHTLNFLIVESAV